MNRRVQLVELNHYALLYGRRCREKSMNRRVQHVERLHFAEFDRRMFDAKVKSMNRRVQPLDPLTRHYVFAVDDAGKNR